MTATTDPIVIGPPVRRPGGPIARVLALARPDRGRLVLCVLAGAGAAATGVALAATSAWLITRAAQHPPVLTLTVAIVAVRAFGLARGFLRYGERLLSHDAALRVMARLRTRTYARLTRLLPARGADLRDGDLVVGFVADVDAALDAIVRVVLPYAVAAVIGVGAAVGLALLLPAAGLAIAVGLAVVTVGVPLLYGRIVGRIEPRETALRAELADRVLAQLRLLPETGDVRVAPAVRSTAGGLDAATRVRAHAAGLSGALSVAATGATATVALAAGAAAHLDPVLVAVVVLTPLAVFEALAALPAATAALRQSRAALARVFRRLDQSDPTPDPGHPRPTPTGPFHLRLRDVSAAWPDGETVLSHVDIDLPPGSRTLVTGPSGSGKSTLAALLVRFLDPVEGVVEINGVDLRALTGEQVRSVVSIVDDRAYLFDSTLAANLRIGAPAATDPALWSALGAVGLADWVRGLPEGLATRVGEHGAELSGGQRRRVALARALLADRPVLVLDEPAEHLDDPAADQLIRDLLTPRADRTVVLITHHPVEAPVDQIVAFGEPGAGVAAPGILVTERG